MLTFKKISFILKHQHRTFFILAKSAQRGVNSALSTPIETAQGGALGRMIMPTAGSQNIHTAPKITSQFIYLPYLSFVLPIFIPNIFRDGRLILLWHITFILSFLPHNSDPSYLNSVESWLNRTTAGCPTLHLLNGARTSSHTGT